MEVAARRPPAAASDARIRVSAPGDHDETEAARVAAALSASVAGGHKAAGAGGLSGADGGAGAWLPPALGAAYGAWLGADLSGVRLHAGDAARRSASSLGAAAYTRGQDIVLGGPGSGLPAPSLLAHELAHVVEGARRSVANVVHRQPLDTAGSTGPAGSNTAASPLAHDLAHVVPGAGGSSADVIHRQPLDAGVSTGPVTPDPQITAAPAPQLTPIPAYAHELHHAAAQAATGRPVLQRFGEPQALTSSMTAQAAAGMDDTTAQSELYEASRALSNPDLPPAERSAIRANRDLLESEVRRRDLPTAAPGAGKEEYTIAGVVLSDDPEHDRYALETMVTAQGTAATDRAVRDVQTLSTDTGRAIANIAYQTDFWRALEPRPEPVFPSPTLARVVTQQWANLKAENDALIRDATRLGNALMAETLARSRNQAETEAQRYGWVSDAQGWTVRRTDSYHLEEEKRLGLAAAELSAKHKRVDEASSHLAGLQWQMNYVGESDMVMAEHVGAQITAAETALAAAKADLITAELVLTKEFPVLASYVSQNDWGDLADLAEDPTDWDYGGRVKRTLLNIVEVQHALDEGETSCWKQDRIVELMRRYQDVPDGSMRARLYQEAVENAHDDPWWKTALTVVAIGLSLLAAIPTGGASLAVTGVVLTAEAAALALDLYLLHDAITEHSLAKAAAGTDLDVANAVSAADPGAVWLAVQILATGIGAAGAVRTFTRIAEARAAIRAATSSDEMAEGVARLRRELDDAKLPDAAKERAVREFGSAGMSSADEVAESTRYPGLDPKVEEQRVHHLAGQVGPEGPVTITPQTRNVRVANPELVAQYEQIANERLPDVVDQALAAERVTPTRTRLNQLGADFDALRTQVGDAADLTPQQRTRANDILREARDLARDDFGGLQQKVMRRLRADPALQAIETQLVAAGDAQAGPTGTLRIKVSRADGTDAFVPLNLEHRVRLSDNPWLAKGNRNIILTDAPQNQQYLETLRQQGSVWPTDAVEAFVVRFQLNDEGINFSPGTR